jgi:hypothetical protein
MAHSFVLSYARKDSRIDDDPARLDPHFETFLGRLNLRVSQLTGVKGFVDRQEIKAGHEWPDELAEALRTTPTMVCMFSPSYFLSDYCGREMQILLERRRKYILSHSGKKPSNIIAVLWHSSYRRIPKTLPEVQYQAPKLDETKFGAWNLGDLGRMAELTAFADEIAIRVRDAADETPLPELPQKPKLNAVRSAFLPPPLPLPEFDSKDAPMGPNAVTFVYASSTKWNAWPWAPPQERAVLHLASAVAKGREMEPTQLAFSIDDENLLERLAALNKTNNVVVVLVDGTSVTSEAFRTRLRDFDLPDYKRFAVVVLWNDNRKADLEAGVDKTFEYFGKRASPHFQHAEGHEKFAEALSAALDQLRLTVIGDPHDPDRIADSTKFPELPEVNATGRKTDE